ncbi:hypothetical protein BGX28_009011 [Mortierella sp. GBA30]|nr:hypothetical protein BGX28_009011 [Mortierella sp. GBA30]
MTQAESDGAANDWNALVPLILVCGSGAYLRKNIFSTMAFLSSRMSTATAADPSTAPSTAPSSLPSSSSQVTLVDINAFGSSRGKEAMQSEKNRESSSEVKGAKAKMTESVFKVSALAYVISRS